MDVMFWNAALSVVTGLLIWGWKAHTEEVKRLQILINRTREEMAKEYITRVDVHHDFARVLDRLDRLDTKIDELIRGGHLNAR